jgi:hypothetical protein
MSSRRIVKLAHIVGLVPYGRQILPILVQMLGDGYRLDQLVLICLLVHVNNRSQLFATLGLGPIVSMVPLRHGNWSVARPLGALLPGFLDWGWDRWLVSDTKTFHADLAIGINEGPAGHLLCIIDGLHHDAAPGALSVQGPQRLHPLSTPRMTLGDAGRRDQRVELRLWPKTLAATTLGRLVRLRLLVYILIVVNPLNCLFFDILVLNLGDSETLVRLDSNVLVGINAMVY